MLDRTVYNIQVPSDYHKSSVQSCSDGRKDFIDDEKTFKSRWWPKIVHFTYCEKPGKEFKEGFKEGCAPFHEYWQEAFTRLFARTEMGENVTLGPIVLKPLSKLREFVQKLEKSIATDKRMNPGTVVALHTVPKRA